MIVAIIPARGGSKRIHRKNIKEFLGAPIISYSIKAAAKTNLFDEIIVSTDDEEIAEIASCYGAKTPFLRPSNLSDDHTGTLPVICHAIKQVEKIYNKSATDACCIYPTAPLIQATHLTQARQMLTTYNADFVFSAAEFRYPIFRSFKILEGGHCKMFWPDMYAKRSQDIPNAYHDAGQFYWGTRDAFITKSQLYSEKSIPMVLPHLLVQDIDTIQDWEMAEQLYKYHNNCMD
ncbi:MAG: pseudaminic acid cytidylyltransferase [Gammaproteobacteria bacterium]|nr:pseudaminic acid cytidylyltransferase [Gammaproteobacteria bacterium]